MSAAERLPTVGCPEAEAAVLGALLMLGAKGADVAAGLEPEDFTDPRHRAVFGAVGELLEQGAATDAVIVLGHLRRSGAERSMTADRDAGVFLADLVTAAPVATCAPYYARIVVEHAARRRLVETAERLGQLAGTARLEVLAETVREEYAAVVAALRRASVDIEAAAR